MSTLDHPSPAAAATLGATTAGMTVVQARRALSETFRRAGLDSPELDARLLTGHALGLDHTGLTIEAGRAVSDDEARAIDALAARRLMREPVARILGHKEFWGLPFKLSAATLVPRPDTETVVERALEIVRGFRDRGLRIADLGTGTGAILLALLDGLPDAFGVGTDISLAALRTARENAADLGLAFQIVDDLLDVQGDEVTTGKSLGTDLAQRKPTLPLIRLLGQVDAAGRATPRLPLLHYRGAAGSNHHLRRQGPAQGRSRFARGRVRPGRSRRESHRRAARSSHCRPDHGHDAG